MSKIEKYFNEKHFLKNNFSKNNIQIKNFLHRNIHATFEIYNCSRVIPRVNCPSLLLRAKLLIDRAKLLNFVPLKGQDTVPPSRLVSACINEILATEISLTLNSRCERPYK